MLHLICCKREELPYLNARLLSKLGVDWAATTEKTAYEDPRMVENRIATWVVGAGALYGWGTRSGMLRNI